MFACEFHGNLDIDIFFELKAMLCLASAAAAAAGLLPTSRSTASFTAGFGLAQRHGLR